MHPLLIGAAYCVAIAAAYFLVMAVSARMQRSRCCGAKMTYRFGWDYRGDGKYCDRCGMLND